MAPSPECSVQSFEVQRASHAGPLCGVTNQQEFAMTKMTKAQLIEENIALRHNIDVLERRLAELSAECQVQHPATEEQIVSTYTKRDGSRWNKVRIGYNLFAHRPA